MRLTFWDVDITWVDCLITRIVSYFGNLRGTYMEFIYLYGGCISCIFNRWGVSQRAFWERVIPTMNHPVSHFDSGFYRALYDQAVCGIVSQFTV